MAAPNVKRERAESVSDGECEVVAGRSPIVSVIIPGEDSDKYLLKCFKDRGWWLPFGKVGRLEHIKVAAQRVATEVSLHK